MLNIVLIALPDNTPPVAQHLAEMSVMRPEDLEKKLGKPVSKVKKGHGLSVAYKLHGYVNAVFDYYSPQKSTPFIPIRSRFVLPQSLDLPGALKYAGIQAPISSFYRSIKTGFLVSEHTPGLKKGWTLTYYLDNDNRHRRAHLDFESPEWNS